MILKPIIKNNICLNAHPRGLEQLVLSQIGYVKNRAKIAKIKTALIIGASTGYGLASRIVAAFSGGAATIGVSSGRKPSTHRTGNVGYYTTRAFDREARAQGLYAESLFGDAFSSEMKEKTISLLKQEKRKIDLFVYSLASGSRKDPQSGNTYRGAIKPIGQSFSAYSIDVRSARVQPVTLEAAQPSEIASAVKVMGGEDWRRWVDELIGHDLLASPFRTIAYSYIGPTLTAPIYRDGTMGKAKEHLEQTAREMDALLAPLGGRAVVCVNKAIVTRSSAVIPLVPLYLSFLYRVMKEKNVHEGCIEQMYRLFAEKYSGPDSPLTDAEGRIRLDDLELREDVQEEVTKLYDKSISEIESGEIDVREFEEEFLRFHGFAWPGVDYEADVDIS
jgi:enoyl-[acyl-carrier protein] reductase/trans-2-enoyl-CoA reductase (NAD+)